MALDIAVVWLLQLMGLVAFATAIFAGFLAWYFILRSQHKETGFKPILLAYITTLCTCILLCIGLMNIEYSSRFTEGVPENQSRLEVILSWTVYMGTLALVVILPALAILTVVTAYLVRIDKYSYPIIFALCASFAIFGGVAYWWGNSGRWLLKDHLELLAPSLAYSFALVAICVLPFFVVVKHTLPKSVNGNT